ncbi:hypothetical protein EJ08DRAFT_695788 [Tothia fuscella]|uniref:Uncharacterized protein n=1 Tax=Tothia fuscella TaxID=1048955 RepID=A0A9P4NUN4_9PEZI|nr:hypothetical protein EJ08DRAFT_695788 [Tothia fuscella]
MTTTALCCEAFCAIARDQIPKDTPLPHQIKSFLEYVATHPEPFETLTELKDETYALEVTDNSDGSKQNFLPSTRPHRGDFMSKEMSEEEFESGFEKQGQGLTLNECSACKKTTSLSRSGRKRDMRPGGNFTFIHKGDAPPPEEL